VQNSLISRAGQGVQIELQISQPVPWRVRVLDGPPRLIVDMREVDWTGIAQVKQQSSRVLGVRAGVFRPGWSRLVLELDGPMMVESAEMATEGATVLRLLMQPSTQEVFKTAAALAEPPDWAARAAVALPERPKKDPNRIVVVLDPGHGGIDPGAERDGQSEANLMLLFAREFQEVLRRDARFEVVMTRNDDSFVPLEARISIARHVAADIFLSLHADALSEGEAVGATIYTLSDEASDEASATLAARHDRDDLLAGVDLTAQDDLVATVLMDMARNETEPRTDRLAKALVQAIKAADLKMHRYPHQRAGFSVLKSPEIPSVLIELGFLSSARDLARLQDAGWRAKMAEALRQALINWSDQEVAIKALGTP
jgi:N-acetylmuramoyl-L-alanine amidase